jgi:hypothetical protein
VFLIAKHLLQLISFTVTMRMNYQRRLNIIECTMTQSCDILPYFIVVRSQPTGHSCSIGRYYYDESGWVMKGKRCVTSIATAQLK